ncbi:hypothetical protein L2D14_01575 [Thalassospiraceae bacterium LMO-JJ14]|nr:hypothetical protein L2D14_01575 [Thalassospiraceae bacterium LMO-JJ14]
MIRAWNSQLSHCDNKVHIKGRVVHEGNENYDFESGDLGDVMGAKGLADAGLAHNFRTIRKWSQTFEGTVDVTSGSHGNILSNPNIKWFDKVPGK